MKRKINLSMSLLTIAVLFLSAALVLSGCYEHFNTQIQEQVRSETRLLAQCLNNAENDISYIRTFDSAGIGNRFTLIDTDGTVLYDSVASQDVENHADRTEVHLALERGYGEAVRFSDTLGSEQFYYALRLDNGHVLRLSSETGSIYQMFLDIIPLLIRLLILLLIIALLVAAKLTKNIVAPINAIDFVHPENSVIYEELSPFVTHITDQNTQIMHQIEEITQQKNRINVITQNMQEGLVILDKNALILSLNKNAAKVFGVKSAAVLGKSFLNVSRDLKINDCVSGALNGENRNIVHELGGRVYRLYCNPVYENEEMNGVILFMVDINDKYSAEKIRREFSANVSHELKTPLTSISGYAEMIASGMVKPDDVGMFAQKIQKESLRLLTLIDDIIKLSRLDENAHDGENFETVNLKAVISETLDILSRQIAEKEIKISVNAQDIQIEGNTSMLSELVYNLCENAIKYNIEGGELRVNLYKNDTGKVLEVTDTGIGIDKKYHDRIFERFFRVDKSHSKKTGGTGLGLSIVKHIAELHHAALSIESELGKGTTIRVVFPS
ncbi:MAG TPA: PAS domain S-box protein [Candidatus Aphodoplasma excrementigallinarum]|uniref:histidine kinase n=1 Tax=Candidatus Aphodoplasma excrementigallinarum TaxID=2840673 RepID=A0A9D1T094_9FIRM|nr:PAS domain S-box protein [Candidatus Aphodoplasma excrementigallinarum]